MGKLERRDSGLLVTKDAAKSGQYWASFTTDETGALFNGNRDEALATLVQFVKDFGQLDGFQCGMGKKSQIIEGGN